MKYLFCKPNTKQNDWVTVGHSDIVIVCICTCFGGTFTTMYAWFKLECYIIAAICTCDSGYAGGACSIDLSLPPNVTRVENSGLCPLEADTCETVTVYGENFVDTNTLTCHYELAEVGSMTLFFYYCFYLYLYIYIKWFQCTYE